MSNVTRCDHCKQDITGDRIHVDHERFARTFADPGGEFDFCGPSCLVAFFNNRSQLESQILGTAS